MAPWVFYGFSHMFLRCFEHVSLGKALDVVLDRLDPGQSLLSQFHDSGEPHWTKDILTIPNNWMVYHVYIIYIYIYTCLSWKIPSS